MYLKSLEIQGFKSFAERVKVEFDRGITAVVGPNGSGKSNILDAVLWVLGEQSNKTIRAKDGTDVIFSGGKDKKPLSMAEVSIVIDNSSKEIALEYSEVKITRRIYISGENEYFINNSRARLKDIQELFLDTGVGKNAYSVIGQGKVERIVLSNPKEIKGIIEEAAGIKKFKKRKEEVEEKFKEIENNIEKITYVEEEVFSNMEPLKEQYEKATLYKELKSNLDMKKSSLYKKDILNKNKIKEEIESFIETETEIIKEEEKKFIEEEKYLEELNLEKEKIYVKIEKIEKEAFEFKEKMEKSTNQKVMYSERLKNLEKEFFEKREYLKEAESKIDEKIKRNKKNIEEYEIIKSRVKKENDFMEGKKNLKEKKEEELYKEEKKINKTKENIVENEIKKIKLKNEIEVNIKKINISSQREEKLTKEREKLSEEYYTLKSEHEKKEEKYKKIKEKKSEELFQKEKILKNIKLYEEKLQELTKKQKETENLFVNKSTKLETLYELEKNHEGFLKGVKEILNAEIKGVISPFVSLIKIPEKYETAIQTAVGNSLQDIVVEDSKTAKRCIEYLQSRNLGRASFLPFDTLKVSEIKHEIKGDGILGYASNLVETDHKYKKIAEFVLGNIIVAENIDVAIEIQKKNNIYGNIVTLDGNIISGRGKMTGGEKIKSGVSVIFDRKREITKLKEEIEELKKIKTQIENQILENQDYYKKNSDEKIKKESEITIFETEIHILGIENESLNEKIKSILKNIEIVKFEEEEETKLLNTIKEQTKKNEKIISEIEEEIKKDKEKQKEAEKLYYNLKSEINENFKKISEENIEFAKIKEKMKMLNEKIEEDEIEIKYMKNSIENEKNKMKIIEEESKELKQLLVKINCEYEISEKEYKQKIEEQKNSKLEYKDKEKNEKEKIIKLKDIENSLIKKKDEYTKRAREYERIEAELENIEILLSEIENNEKAEPALNENEVKKEIKQIEEKINNLGEVNMLSITEYWKIKEKYEFIVKQKSDLIEGKKSLENLIKEIEKEIIEKFTEAYEKIKLNFQYMCNEMLNNSKGDMILTEENLLETGIELNVKFKNKSRQTLSLLSGGEKSMVAVAFIMAIFMYKPSPFTFFDEIEAALDESNTKKMVNILKEFTDKSQFILITHNKETMRNADTLYGVTMNKEEGVSRVVYINL